MTKNNVADGPRIAGNKIDDTRRQARFFENLRHLIVAVDRAARALPHDRIAHQRRDRRKIARDRSEVERSDGENETFQGTIVHLIPRPGRRKRLIPVEAFGKVNVETKKVDGFADRVDFGLMCGLALIEHRRCVDLVASYRRQQFRGSEKYRGAIFKLPGGPFLCALSAAWMACVASFLRRVPCGEHVSVLVRHDGLRRFSRSDFLALDEQGYLDLLARLPRKAFAKSEAPRVSRAQKNEQADSWAWELSSSNYMPRLLPGADCREIAVENFLGIGKEDENPSFCGRPPRHRTHASSRCRSEDSGAMRISRLEIRAA